MQPKLEVSHPDDPQEKEAESVATEVMRAADPVAAPPDPGAEGRKDEVARQVQRTPLFARISRQAGMGGFASHGSTDDEASVQAMLMPAPDSRSIQPTARRPPSNGEGSASSFEDRLSSTRGEGAPLSGDTRSHMESRFGADFGGVRVQTGARAERLSGGPSAGMICKTPAIQTGVEANTTSFIACVVSPLD